MDGRYYVFYALSDESYHLQVTDDFNSFEEIKDQSNADDLGVRGKCSDKKGAFGFPQKKIRMCVLFLKLHPMSAEELAGVCYSFFSEGFALNRKDVTKEKLVDFLKLCKEASEKWMLNESHKWIFDQEDGGGVPQLLTGQADLNFSYAYGLNQIQYLQMRRLVRL